MVKSPTIRTEQKPGYMPVDIYCDELAKGRVSAGGYIGPEIVVPCEVGWTTTVIDDSYVGGARIDVRVARVSDTLVHIEIRDASGKRYEPANPLPRIERQRPAQECSECRAPVGPGGHSKCNTHRASPTPCQ